MGLGSGISWLHPPGFLRGATWSPWHGCTRVHTGCQHCWAEALDRNRAPLRDAEGKLVLDAQGCRQASHFGKGRPRRVTADSGWKLPLSWARSAAKAGTHRIVSPLDCDPLDPEVWERPGDMPGANRATAMRFMNYIRVTTRFCACGTSMLWEENHRDHRPPLPYGGLTWLLLTKRPENWRWIPEDVRRFCWLIYSASDQETLDRGMPHLLAAEGFAGLGLSLEPLVGPIDLGGVVVPTGWTATAATLSRVNHVIIGGESGIGARPCYVDWIRSLVRQCREAGVPPYVKQLGSNVACVHCGGRAACVGVYEDPEQFAEAACNECCGHGNEDGWCRQLEDGHGGNLAEWPEDIRVQEWPEGLRGRA